MAGYSFETSAVNNNHHHNQNTPNNHQKASRFTTASSSTSLLNRFGHLKFDRYSTPKSSLSLSSSSIQNNKIIKNKNRSKMNSFQNNEREKFKKLLMEHVNVSNRNIFQQQQQRNESAINSSSILMQKSIPLSSNNKILDHHHQQHRTNSYSLLNMVQSKCFTTSLASNYHQNDSMRKNSLTNNSTSRLNLIQDYWQLPEKSNDFKSSVENKISLVYSKNTISPTSQSSSSTTLSKSFSFSNKEKSYIDNDDKSNINDIKIYEKLNSVKILKNNRESITTKIKSMFEPFISYNFYLKFKRYIPYIQRDHQISKQIEELGDEEEETTKTTIVPLTEEIEDEIDEILQNSNQLLVSAYSIHIHTKDIMTLDGCNWLNDAVIEFYLNLIVSRSQMNDKNCNRKKLYPTVYAFSTYFFTRLSNGSGPGRWSNKLDFFSYDILLIPIHHSNHWRLAVVDNEQHSIEYYDSLGNEFRYCIDLIFNFLQNESIKKKNTELDIEKWRLQYKIPNIPKQQNYYDCGVFVCKYAEYISRRASLTFTQKHIPAFRKLMMYEIIHQKLIV
ncbi:uncharacterized protein LOC113797765 [Dermatophagoides pteronyssinus]|uniref:uncharacterized protein LOC113797765 n=1 Tax=Dermatophagoides pteronyssinus TaxID=6956 RepID=UPI003F67B426